MNAMERRFWRDQSKRDSPTMSQNISLAPSVAVGRFKHELTPDQKSKINAFDTSRNQFSNTSSDISPWKPTTRSQHLSKLPAVSTGISTGFNPEISHQEYQQRSTHLPFSERNLRYLATTVEKLQSQPLIGSNRQWLVEPAVDEPNPNNKRQQRHKEQEKSPIFQRRVETVLRNTCASGVLVNKSTKKTDLYRDPRHDEYYR